MAELTNQVYEGHSRINDNEFISRKVSLGSVLLVMPHVYHSIICSYYKFGAMII